MKTRMFAIGALILLGGVDTTQAQDRPAPAKTIRLADLDLTDAGQANQALKRIRVASADVCRASPGTGGNDIQALELYDRCFRESVARAVIQLDAPLVTAAYERGSRPVRRLARLP